MACCVFTALIMNGIIRACDKLDLQLFNIRYNDADELKYMESTDNQEGSASGHISIRGMTCSSCATQIEQELQKLEGVFRASVSLTLGRAIVSYNHAQITPARMIECVDSTGYKSTWGSSNPQDVLRHLHMSEKLEQLRSAIRSASLEAALILVLEKVAFSMATTRFGDYLSQSLLYFTLITLSFKIQVCDAWSIHSQAWAQIKRRFATMETLLSLSLLSGVLLCLLEYLTTDLMASNGAYAVSGSFLTVVILAGRYLEALLRREANSNLVALYDLQSQKNTYLLEGSLMSLPATLLKKGDRIVLVPGAPIPCDCYIISGSSLIDEATITGEPEPVKKGIGDFLLSGTRNLARRLTVVVVLDHTESSLSKIIETISSSTDQRPEGTKPLEQLMSKFVSTVLILALITGLSAAYRFRRTSCSHALVVAFEKAMTVLAAACPCGIGLAVPSAALAGIDAAHGRGILLGGGIRTMETVSQVTDLVMDKTGTLTSGNLRVVGNYLDPKSNFRGSLCFRLLAASEVEDARVHPVAKAIFKWALENSRSEKSSTEPDTLAATRNLRQVLGTGLQCEVEVAPDNWVMVHVGTSQFLLDNDIRLPIVVDCDDKHSAVFFAFNRQFQGYLFIQDSLREESQTIVEALRREGLDITISTGDTAVEADRVSRQLSTLR